MKPTQALRLEIAADAVQKSIAVCMAVPSDNVLFDVHFERAEFHLKELNTAFAAAKTQIEKEKIL